MIGETAELAVRLKLDDKMSPGIKKAEASVASLNATAGKTGAAGQRISQGFNTASKAATGFGNALGHAKGVLGGLLTGPLGMIGLGAGIVGVSKFLQDAVGSAEEFGVATKQLTQLTHMSTEAASAYIDVLDKYGISGDAAIKVTAKMSQQYGVLIKSHKDAATFGKAYFDIVGPHGEALGAEEILKRSAAFWKSNATATEKATALTKLWGKSWRDLIPIFSLSDQKIDQNFKTANTLTREQLQNILALTGAQKELNDNWRDMATMIGVALIPQITEVVRGLNSFVVTHQQEIINFFKGAAKFAKEFGAAIQNTIVPAIGAIAGAWNSLPSEIKQLLIGGFVANKALKMTFGVDVVDTLRKTLFNAVLGIKAGVVNVTGAVVNTPGGLPGDPVTGGKGIWATVKKFIKDFGVDLAVGIKALLKGAPLIGAGIAIDRNAITGPDSAYGQWRLAHEPQGKASTLGSFVNSAGYQGFEGKGGGYRPADAVMATTEGFTKTQNSLRVLHEDFEKQFGLLKTSKDPAAIAAAAAAVAEQVTKGTGNVGTTKDIIATLKQQIAATKDPALRHLLQTALSRVEKKLPGREWIAAQEKSATKIAHSNESVGQKVSELKQIQRELLAKGDTTAAKIVGALLGSVVPAINGISINVNQQINGLPSILPTTHRNPKNRTDTKVPTPSGHRPKHPGGIGGRQGGGPVYSGAAYLVGEDGPEWFVPGVAGKVSPQGGGSRQIHVSMNANVSTRSVDSGAAVQSRYGPTAVRAGAATLLV